MTLHLVGFPHTRLDGGFDTCAYTQKCVRFRRLDLGDELVVYGHGGDIEPITETERIELFGLDDPSVSPAWPTPEQWRLFNARAVAAIAERSRPGDLVLIAGGYDQRVVASALPDLRVVEPFVGYEGITTGFCAFESYAWRHYVYGLRRIGDGRWFDTVIPNYFDQDDFPQLNDGDGDYLLFVGRMISRKGIVAAADIARACGMRLVYAGPGVSETAEGLVVAEGHRIEGDVLHVGTVGARERAQLMAGARALLVPTIYVEPFGGVAVEAMFAGTPVVASDFGAFTETVETGLTGFRFSTLREAVDAVGRTGDLDPGEIHGRAVERFSLEAVAPLFRDWFARLRTLDKAGWYEMEAPSGIRV